MSGRDGRNRRTSMDEGDDYSQQPLRQSDTSNRTGGFVSRLSTQMTEFFEDRGIKLSDVNVLKRGLVNCLLILSWYTFSVSISIYNRWMFAPKKLGFEFPLFTTSLHMLVQYTLASLVLFFFPRFRPSAASKQSPEQGPTKGSVMNLRFYFSRIAPCGAATGLDIGLGNTSMQFITLSFYTMCKSSALGFVLLFAFLFRLEQPSVVLCAIIGIMTIGVLMMVAGETYFSLVGFILVISSSFFSGFRWALTQVLLLRNPATSNPFSSIFFLAPIMFTTLLIIASVWETFPAFSAGLHSLAAAKGTLLGFGLLLFPGCLAFCMTASEFALLKRTSVVTLSIAGILKELLTISASQFVDSDPLTPVNITGLCITLISIGIYNYIKIKKMRREEASRLEGKQVDSSEDATGYAVLHDQSRLEEDDREEEDLSRSKRGVRESSHV